jgi:hypothetical protein
MVRICSSSFASHLHLVLSSTFAGYNHSGKGGQINFLNGIMGIANAQRTLDYIRIIAEFVSQPEWRDVVQMFGIVNEGNVFPFPL